MSEERHLDDLQHRGDACSTCNQVDVLHLMLVTDIGVVTRPLVAEETTRALHSHLVSYF